MERGVDAPELFWPEDWREERPEWVRRGVPVPVV